MQDKSRKQRIIYAESTDGPPIEDIYRQVDELGEDWRLVSATVIPETVSGKTLLTGRTYRRYHMTAVVELRNA